MTKLKVRHEGFHDDHIEEVRGSQFKAFGASGASRIHQLSLVHSHLNRGAWDTIVEQIHVMPSSVRTERQCNPVRAATTFHRFTLHSVGIKEARDMVCLVPRGTQASSLVLEQRHPPSPVQIPLAVVRSLQFPINIIKAVRTSQQGQPLDTTFLHRTVWLKRMDHIFPEHPPAQPPKCDSRRLARHHQHGRICRPYQAAKVLKVGNQLFHL